MTLVDGQPCEVVSVADRGLNYGDGLFETIAVIGAEPLLLDEHLHRLAAGCRRMAIAPPPLQALESEARAVCAGVDRGVLKIVVTRGAGGRGYRPDPGGRPTRVVSVHAWPAYPPAHRHEGVAVFVADTRLARAPRLAGLKHLNRLEQVLAALELADRAYPECLMLDEPGCVIEGSRSNVFFVDGEVLVTPALERCGVAGVMRAAVLGAARALGVDVQLRDVARAELGRFTDAFLTNSVIGVWPLARIDAAPSITYRKAALQRALVEQLGRRGALPEA